MGTRLDLKSPETFNEKLQWIKLYDRKPEYTQMADKYEVRKIISQKIGGEYLIPLLGVWDKFDDIDFDKLPNQFVLKCNHDSGSLVICKDKASLNIKQAKKIIEKCLKQNYYYYGRQWVYKDITPRIIAEKYMTDESGSELKDYKVFCFNGEPKIIQVDFNRFTDHKRNFYSIDWEYQSFAVLFPTDEHIFIQKPKDLGLLLNLSRKLSDGIAQLRCDFYIINEKIYFGELTFYHGDGYEKFTPPEWDRKLGDWIALPLSER
jgi:hypothetical protein